MKLYRHTVVVTIVSESHDANTSANAVKNAIDEMINPGMSPWWEHKGHPIVFKAEARPADIETLTELKLAGELDGDVDERYMAAAACDNLGDVDEAPNKARPYGEWLKALDAKLEDEEV